MRCEVPFLSDLTGFGVELTGEPPPATRTRESRTLDPGAATTPARHDRYERRDMSSDNFFYRLEGKFTKLGPIGLVTDGLRMDNEFAGTITDGALAGAQMTGIDFFRIRADGVGVVDAREMIHYKDEVIAVHVTGYVLPPADMEFPSLAALTAPDFTWPDAAFTIEALATFETASAEFAHLNRMAVVHTGHANMATGELTVVAHRILQSQDEMIRV